MYLNMIHAGKSRCPMCGRKWIVTPTDDCLLPACGCFGHDTSELNPNRPCNSCGLNHAFSCEKLNLKGRMDMEE